MDYFNNNNDNLFDINNNNTNSSLINQKNSIKISNDFDLLINKFNIDINNLLVKKFDEKKNEFTNNLETKKNEYKNKNDNINKERNKIEKRLDLLKKKNNDNNLLIIKIIDNQNKRKTLNKIFNFLYCFTKFKKNRRKRMEIALNNYNNNIKRQLFRYWKNFNLEKIVIKKIDKEFNIILKENKSLFLNKVNQYKKILEEIDEKINWLKKTRSEFSYSYSQTILQKISNLNKELGTIKKNDLENLNNNKETKKILSNIVEKINYSYNQLDSGDGI